MAVILSGPPSLSLSASIPPFVIQATSETVVQLYKNGDILLNEKYYPDQSGTFVIDLRFIVDAVLSLNIPTANVFLQTEAFAEFKLIAGSTSQTFTVVKSGIDEKYFQYALGFLKQNFLTNQPRTMWVKYDDPQYLTYYTTELSKLMVLFHYDGNTQEVEIASMPSGSIYTVNVTFSYVRKKIVPVSLRPTHFDVYIKGQYNNYLSKKQRYILTDDYDEFDDLFLFENSKGGLDTIRFCGTLESKDDHKTEIAEFTDQSREFDFEFSRIYTKYSGKLDSELLRVWASEFLTSTNRYHYFGKKYKRIIVQKFDSKAIKGELNDFSFDFFYSDVAKYTPVQADTDLLEPETLVPAPVYNPLTTAGIGSMQIGSTFKVH